MDRIAIITPCLLPVPAVRGGAVEILITGLIEENEIIPAFEIDVFTISDERLSSYNYVYTEVVEITKSKECMLIDKVLDKAYRTISDSCSSRRIFDKYIANAFENRLIQVRDNEKNDMVYKAVIVENMMSTAIKISSCLNRLDQNSKLYFHMHNDIDIYRSKKDCKLLASMDYSFLAISQYIKNRIESCGVDGVTEVLYNGLDKAFYSTSYPDDRKALRREYYIEENDIVFMYSGRLIKEKGILELMESYRLLISKYSGLQLKLIIVGAADFSSDCNSNYENQLRKLKEDIDDKVIFTGKIAADKMPLMNEIADVVVIPSKWEEPLGMVALEAMSLGKAIIATRSGGLVEMLDNESSILVSKDEKMVEELFNAMETMLDLEYRINIGKRAFDRFNEHPEFKQENYFKNFVEAING